eukprot:CAMPEP_0117884676 /NCGR_PEP_ID=MMETSP0950-20121206/19065_1 /TAXON_ID=44440 /ORGANISM="Chattonella subsalsa, Strain CCMP2191" /LENGTH=431 /DNA_ID=CAMNT_0005741175 /DNA_START=11 /DNA_END=1306 /DNA_ORIENTATION=-
MYAGAGDSINAIVADFGSYTSKVVGFAGEDIPAAVTKSIVGEKSSSGDEDSQYIMPDQFPQYESSIELKNILQEGLISDWDKLENIWEYSLLKRLSVDPKEHPCLLVERSFNSSLIRHKICEIWFEKYSVPAFFMSKDAVLSCFASGRTSGVVADIGGEVTTITPVSDGWVESKGIVKSLIAGNTVNKYLHYILEKKGQNFTPKYSRRKKVRINETGKSKESISQVHSSYNDFLVNEALKDAKESLGRMSDSPVDKSDPRFTNIPKLIYELPDGTSLSIGVERFEVAELMVDTSPLTSPLSAVAPASLRALVESIGRPGFSRDPVQSLICESVLRCDRDQQAQLLNNVILAGGGSCFEGMPERLKSEVEKIVHMSTPGWKVKVIAAGVNERKFSAWLGGSILASLGSYHELWMSKAEYEEHGSHLIDRKCP